jgi:hypothetical protein
VGSDGTLYSGANSAIISYNPAYTFTWGQLNYTASLPPGATLSVDVLSVKGALLMSNVPGGKSLATIDARVYANLRLRANLSTTDGAVTLHWSASHWSANPASGDVTLPVSLYIGDVIKLYISYIHK